MTLDEIRRTSNNKLAGSIRIFLAVLFVLTGAMKLFVPMLAEAWSGQLLAAGLPLYEISRWSVPFVEIGVGGSGSCSEIRTYGDSVRALPGPLSLGVSYPKCGLSAESESESVL